MIINSLETLRSLYAAPKERALRKQLSALDLHCRRFIELSPICMLATCNTRGMLDASPRGGPPGFVRLVHDNTLLLPDAPGNNRLDSLENIIAHPRVGMLFLVPGVDETLRVNGNAVLSVDPADIASCTDERRAPKLVVRIVVEEAYLHCAKALMRSRLWSPETRIERSSLPTMGQMLHDQTGGDFEPESQEDMDRRYQADL